MGLTTCTITAHNLLHLREDAMRFSHPDNFWCFNFERAVKCYVRIPSNFKNFLCSFEKRELLDENYLKSLAPMSSP